MTWSGTQSLTTVAATNSAIWSSWQAPSRALSRSQKTYSPGRISVITLLVENSIVGVDPALTTSAVIPDVGEAAHRGGERGALVLARRGSRESAPEQPCPG